MVRWAVAERSTEPKNLWTLISEASSTRQGWHKTTRVLSVVGGFLYLTTTEHRAVGVGGGRILACSEALVFVPDSPASKWVLSEDESADTSDGLSVANAAMQQSTDA